MKVVEKLFNSYNQVASDRYLEKYLAAVSVLELTDGDSGDRMAKVRKLSARISDAYPVSVHKAVYFLHAPVSKLTFIARDNSRITFDKARGDDLNLHEALGRFIERVNAELVKSLEAYNTDRGRVEADDDDAFGDLFGGSS